MKIKVGNKVYEVDDIKEGEIPSEIVIETTDVIRNESEEEAFVKNMKTVQYKAGAEETIKKAKETFGLDFQGKSIKAFEEAVRVKAVEDANIEPTQQIKALQTKLKNKEDALTNVTNKVETLESTYAKERKEGKISRFIEKNMPKELLLDAEDMATVLSKKMTIDVAENGMFGVKGIDGEFRTSKTTGDIMDAKEIIKDFFIENKQYLTSDDGGRKGSDSSLGGSGKMTVGKFIDSYKESGKAAHGEEFNKELAAGLEDGSIVQEDE